MVHMMTCGRVHVRGNVRAFVSPPKRRRNVHRACRACRERAAARCIVRPGQGEDISVTLYTYNYGVAFRWSGVYVWRLRFTVHPFIVRLVMEYTVSYYIMGGADES